MNPNKQNKKTLKERRKSLKNKFKIIDMQLAGKSNRSSGVHEIKRKNEQRFVSSTVLSGLRNSDILAMVSPRKPLRVVTGNDASKVNRGEAKPLHFCQDGVSAITRDGLTLEELALDIRNHGWLVDREGKLTDPIHVVEMNDGSFVTVDHRRPVAVLSDYCRENRLFTVIHQEDTALPATEHCRFTGAKTWGEAVVYRLSQNREKKTPSPVLRIRTNAPEILRYWSEVPNFK